MIKGSAFLSEDRCKCVSCGRARSGTNRKLSSSIASMAGNDTGVGASESAMIVTSRSTPESSRERESMRS